MADRETLIQHIEGLYPADSKWEDSATIGKVLLANAIADKWRELSVDMLYLYAEQCTLASGEPMP